jgi:hypothetical protein
MFLRLEAKILWEKYSELYSEYYNEMTNQYENFNKFDRFLMKYAEKYNYMDKKHNKLKQQMKKINTKDIVINFVKTQRNIVNSQHINTLKDQVNVFNAFTDFKKKIETPQVKTAKLLSKIFTSDKRSKLSEDKNRLLSYFMDKYKGEIESGKKESVKNNNIIPSLDLKSISPDKPKGTKSPAKNMKLNSTRAYDSEKINDKKAKIFGEGKTDSNGKHAKRNSINDGNKKLNMNKSVVEKSSKKNKNI